MREKGPGSHREPCHQRLSPIMTNPAFARNQMVATKSPVQCTPSSRHPIRFLILRGAFWIQQLDGLNSATILRHDLGPCVHRQTHIVEDRTIGLFATTSRIQTVTMESTYLSRSVREKVNRPQGGGIGVTTSRKRYAKRILGRLTQKHIPVPVLYLICNDVDRVGGIVEKGLKLEALRGTGLGKAHHFKQQRRGLRYGKTPESSPAPPPPRHS
ncbi:hypothetical protein EDD85DRAFT_379172 [Armillaria nabsnona]|nr:hypothetical protein EDD85DRAFT_379172 [Armillaria nabsnona]